MLPEELKPTDSARQPKDDESISTSKMAAITGLSEATLRNYAWLASHSKRVRRERGLQDPPPHFPKPKRERGRLRWPRAAAEAFALERKEFV